MRKQLGLAASAPAALFMTSPNMSFALAAMEIASDDRSDSTSVPAPK
jgi:hypothetical protein